MRTYMYVINLNERGDFYADVREDDENGDTIFEICSNDDGTIWTIEDGFMRHVNDLIGLQNYLVEWGFMDINDTLLTAGA